MARTLGLAWYQRPAVLLVDVETRDQAVGRPGERPVVELDAGGRAIVVRPVLHLAPLLGGRHEPAPLCPVARGRRGPDELAERIEIDAALDQARARLRIAVARPQRQFVREHDVEVRAQREPLRPVPVHDAGFIIVGAGYEVAHRVRAAPQTRVVALHEAVVEDRAVAVDALILVDVEAFQLIRLRVAPPAQARALLRVPHPVRAGGQRHVELGVAGRAALGDDLHDAVRRFRAVQRRRRGSLDDLDAGDVVRVQVVQAAHAAAAPLTGAAARIAVHANAVDVDDRVRAEGQTGDAADLQRRSGADLSGGRHRDEAGHALREQLVHVGRGSEREHLGRIDALDHVADRAPLRAARGPRHHDRVQIERPLGELDVHRRGVAVRYARRPLHRAVAEELEHQAHLAGRNAREHVTTLRARERPQIRPGHPDGDGRERAHGPCFHDRARDRADALRWHRIDDADRECRCRGQRRVGNRRRG